MTQPLPNPADATDLEIERQLRASRQLEDAPEYVIQRALAAWQPRRTAAAVPGLLERIVALLTFDSGAASPLAFGVRSAGGTRQLLFSAEGHDIDLRVAPAGDGAPDHWLLSGQVFGPESLGTVVVLGADGRGLVGSLLSDLGEFRLPAVPAGRYTMALRLSSREIVLPPIDLPQPAA